MNKSKSLKICLFFYTIYGIAHFYIFLKVKYIFHIGTPEDVFLGLFLLFMTFSPFFTYLYSLRGSATLSRVFAYIGYMWVALLILFFSTAVLIELYNLTIRLSGLLLQKDLSRIILSPMSTFFIPLFLSIAFNTYGYFEAKSLRVERLTVGTSKLPEEMGKLTIAHISDLHLGLLVGEKILDKVLKEIENAKPDLIVSTGDLLDAEVNHIDYLAGELKRVHARLGKFAVTGNHEFYVGIEHSLKFLRDAGFTTLRGEGITIQNLINIAGVDDPEDHKNTVFKSEREILSKLPPDTFTLLLKHTPDLDKNSLGLFDLQLSGHTHKGQIFPINIATKLLFYSHVGYTNLSKGSAIYVSRGAGTAGPPVRFLSPPEITIIEVVSTKQSQMATDKKTDDRRYKKR